MRNLVHFKSADEAFAYMQKLYKTKEFRTNEWVQWHTRKAAGRVPVFYEMSHPDVEASHFTAWFNAIALRDWYDNDYIHDLYLFHEYVHLATMEYASRVPWADWYTKILKNELEASLASEAFVYLHVPGLREKTFNHKIWADRFGELEGTDTLEKEKEIRAARIQVLTCPSPFDFLEQQIASYAGQNQEWTRIWAKQWRTVERHMEAMLAIEDVAERSAAHVEWLNSLSTCIFPIPFRNQAEEFARVYRANKEKFGNVLAEEVS